MKNQLALYIHFPFCKRKCNYCSFVSYAHREADIPAYVNALNQELAQRATNQRVGSIFCGGGTPSLLSPKQIKDILATIHSRFTVDNAAEATLEANPGTIDESYLRAIRKLGINRLSLGIQSLNDDELRWLGRLHTATEAKEAVYQARQAGFSNLNLDLIYGLPGQTLSSWQHTLSEALRLSPEHLSLYALSLEDDVPMGQAIKQGRMPPLNPDRSADQYELAEDQLEAPGYHHYEISNWAREGYQCQHNLTYWHNQPYLGVGVAAHSYIKNHRLANTTDLDRYLAASGNPSQVKDNDEEIKQELQLTETVILGLRLSQGVSIDDIQGQFGIDLGERYRQPIDELVSLGLIEWAGRHLRLTRYGQRLGNEAFWRFLPD